MQRTPTADSGPWWAAARALSAFLLLLIATTVIPSGTDGAGPSATKFVVFFNNDSLAADSTDCAAVFPVERTVPPTQAVAQAALHSLFGGPTPPERAAGYRSFFSDATTDLLRRIRVKSGTAYVDLHDLRMVLSGATSSCGSAELLSQIERTLGQFRSIKRVRLAIEGDPRIFHEWLNDSCDRANGDCDPQPLRSHP